MKKRKPILTRLVCTLMLSGVKIAVILLSLSVLCREVPYFYVAVRLIGFLCLGKIIASDENAEYKVPWLILVLAVPTVGLILYFTFHSQILPYKYIKRLDAILNARHFFDDTASKARLAEHDTVALGQARLLCAISGSHIYDSTDVIYFPSGRDALCALLKDIYAARRFVYLEYYIIACGEFFNSVIDALSERASAGVDVRIVYDGVGCIQTLPPNFERTMRSRGISAVEFSRPRGGVDRAFNNRSHRKITVIDGKIAYTGGINIADEYVGLDMRLGVWKDCCVRLCGEGASELTRLFLCDYWLNAQNFDKKELCVLSCNEAKNEPAFTLKAQRAKSPPRKTPLGLRRARAKSYNEKSTCENAGFIIPFGDGPQPFYRERVSKSLLVAMISSATESVYLTTPYLIADSELLCVIENAARRGVQVKIVLPSIPDKPLVYLVSESFFPRLLRAGVQIYLFADGFIHSKTYLIDGKYALVGTMNLDYRSLVHNFECGVWMYLAPCIEDIKSDARATLLSSRRIYESMICRPLKKRFICSIVRIIAPLL